MRRLVRSERPPVLRAPEWKARCSDFSAAADGNDEGYHRRRRDAGDQPFGKWTAGAGFGGWRFRVSGRTGSALDVPDGRRFSCRVGDDLKQSVHILRAVLGQGVHAEGKNVEFLLRQPWTAGQGVLYHAVGCQESRSGLMLASTGKTWILPSSRLRHLTASFCHQNNLSIRDQISSDVVVMIRKARGVKLSNPIAAGS